MTPRWAALAVALALGAACGGSSGGSREPPNTGPKAYGTAAVSLPAPSTSFRPGTTAVAALFEFVDYLVSGGPAGVSDHLKVYPDGRAVYDAGAGKPETTFSVSPATVAELRAALEAADLAALPPVSGTPSPDAPAYRVLYGGQAVRFYDGAVPDSLRPALAILDRELSRGKRPRP